MPKFSLPYRTPFGDLPDTPEKDWSLDICAVRPASETKTHVPTDGIKPNDYCCQCYYYYYCCKWHPHRFVIAMILKCVGEYEYDNEYSYRTCRWHVECERAIIGY